MQINPRAEKLVKEMRANPPASVERSGFLRPPGWTRPSGGQAPQR